MNDLISRKEAIDAIRESTSKYKGFFMGMEMYTDDDAVEAIEGLTPAQKWTPCSNGLPKAGVRYQVTFESGEVGYADFRDRIFLWDGSVKENVWEIDQYYEDEGGVVAWMHLPEPYKDDKMVEEKECSYDGEETIVHCNLKENAELIAKILDADIDNEVYENTGSFEGKMEVVE